MKNILLLIIFIALISCSKNPTNPETASSGENMPNSNTPKSWLNTVKNKKATQIITHNNNEAYYNFLENGDIRIDYLNNNNKDPYIFQYEQTPTNAVYERNADTGKYFIGFAISNENILCYTGPAGSADKIYWGYTIIVGQLEDQ